MYLQPVIYFQTALLTCKITFFPQGAVCPLEPPRTCLAVGGQKKKEGREGKGREGKGREGEGRGGKGRGGEGRGKGKLSHDERAQSSPDCAIWLGTGQWVNRDQAI